MTIDEYCKKICRPSIDTPAIAAKLLGEYVEDLMKKTRREAINEYREKLRKACKYSVKNGGYELDPEDIDRLAEELYDK